MPEQTQEKPIDGEFTERASEERGLSVIAPKEVTLSTIDPERFLKRAVRQADALKAVIDKKGLARVLGNGRRPYVFVGGWQTLMTLNGVVAFALDVAREHCVPGECHVVVGRDETGDAVSCRGDKLTVRVVTEARRASDGAPLSRVVSECSQHEKLWSSRDEFAVLSMAQTRGISRVGRQLFGWVMELAGYEATPAEEMPSAPEAPPSKVQAAAAAPISDDDRALIRQAFNWNQAVRADKHAKPASKEACTAVIHAYAAFANRDHLACCSIQYLGKWEDLWARGGAHIDELFSLFGIERTKPSADEAGEAAATPGSADGPTFDPDAVPVA